MIRFHIDWRYLRATSWALMKRALLYTVIWCAGCLLLYLTLTHYLDQRTVLAATIQVTTPEQITEHAVTITAYHPGPAEGWGDGCTTADGTEICQRPLTAPWICAVSPDLLEHFPFGTRLTLSTLGGFWTGECEVHDRTHRRFVRRVDVLVPGGVPANLFPASMAKEKR